MIMFSYYLDKDIKQRKFCLSAATLSLGRSAINFDKRCRSKISKSLLPQRL